LLKKDQSRSNSSTQNKAYSAKKQAVKFKEAQKEAARLGQYTDNTKRSQSYARQMRKIEERAQRHMDQSDFDYLYSSDISASKKLKSVEEKSNDSSRKVHMTTENSM